jgi:heparosan-N-sulfate-glucuronate 5-epimerase
LQLRDPGGLPLVAAVVDWLERFTDERGLLPYRFPMPHTYSLEAPWYSSLAQGEAASLLVRAAQILGRPDLVELADRVTEPLLRAESPLVESTPEGLVLQEYPTDPPAHVLNGWITSLFGLYDVAHAPRDGTATSQRAREAFTDGTGTLAARLHLYRTPLRWSRYDLYPHPLPNTASHAYHRLHVAQLRALHSLTGNWALAATADDWERSLTSPPALLVSLARKIAFRVVRPRSRRVR